MHASIHHIIFYFLNQLWFHTTISNFFQIKSAIITQDLYAIKKVNLIWLINSTFKWDMETIITQELYAIKLKLNFFQKKKIHIYIEQN